MDTEQKDPQVSPKHQALDHFLQDNDPLEVSRTLRYVFFDFLRSQHEGLPVHFYQMLHHIENLFVLLDQLQSDESE